MVFNVFKKAKEIFFNNSDSGLVATDVQSAIVEVNGRNKKISINKKTNTTVKIKESCLLIWSQNSNCGGVIVVDRAINYINKIVTVNDDAGNFSVSVSGEVLTLKNNLEGSVQCYVLSY